jgi:hypothetical protein
VIKFAKNKENITILNETEGKEMVTSIKVEGAEERERWLRHLAEHAADHNRYFLLL